MKKNREPAPSMAEKTPEMKRQSLNRLKETYENPA
jgi:hypothetical protein